MSATIVETIGNETQFKKLEAHPYQRIAIVGKSNVGKSSLINKMTESKVAYVSKKPGKTKLIHFYLWKELKLMLVDLPGYGYASVSKDQREDWADLIEKYFNFDQSLNHVLFLLDLRHEPSSLDEEAFNYFLKKRIPMTLILTKSDALKNQSEKSKQEKFYKNYLSKKKLNPDLFFPVSSKTSEGIKNLIRYLGEIK